ncbi:MAG TPA: histidine phosphatase family protein [Candidatus Dormibacteraeota bacterium]|nr:histidine phosphatase family protein [Candidatus Dormibacteraeota bacterium]
MRHLILLRHAKSSWADAGQPDRERPLAPRGRRAARRLAAYLERQGVRPDVVLCSPAVRTRQTLDLVRSGLGERVEVLLEDELYGASAGQLLARLRCLPETVTTAMVVGHNPGIQELTVLLAHQSALRERAGDHFPTAALATLDIRRGSWPALDAGRAELVAFLAPRDLSVES